MSRTVQAQNRSCLQEAYRSGKPLMLYPLRAEPLFGFVVELTDREVVFQKILRIHREAHRIREPLKLKTKALKYAAFPPMADMIRNRKVIDWDLRFQRYPIPRTHDEWGWVDDGDLARCHRSREPLLIRTSDGDGFVGRLAWWTPRELGLELEAGLPMTFFRHALFGLRPAKEEELKLFYQPRLDPVESAVLDAICDKGCRTILAVAEKTSLGYATVRRVISQNDLLSEMKALRTFDEVETLLLFYREGSSVQKLAEASGSSPRRIRTVFPALRAEFARRRLSLLTAMAQGLESRMRQLRSESISRN